jgi:hypothetical protein
MADEPENHTLWLLREMREENLRFHAETREQLGGMRADNEQRFAGMREENLRVHTETRGQLALVLETVVDMAKTVNTTAEAVTELNGRVEIIEGRLNIVDGRLARIEKHTGLVKA